MRESFLVYKSFFILIKLLPEKSQLRVYKAMFEYNCYGNNPTFETEQEQAIWESIVAQLDANNRRYENAKKGGAPIGNQNAKKQLKATEKQPNINQETTEKSQVNTDDFETNQKITKEEKEETTPFFSTEKQPNDNVNVNDNVNDIYNLSACAHEKLKLSGFLENHKNIVVDTCSTLLADMDFDLISNKIDTTPFLQQITSLHWFVVNYSKIKSGYYNQLKKKFREKEDFERTYTSQQMKEFITDISNVEF